MKNDCKGIFGFLFGHKFIAQYDTKVEYQDEILTPEIKEHVCILNAYVFPPIKKQESKYIKSICKRCGEEINDQKVTPEQFVYKDKNEWFDKNKEQLRSIIGFANPIVGIAFDAGRELK